MKKFKSPSDIKVGVIGYGGAFNMGRQHLNEMKRAGMTPFAVCEINEERRKVAEQEFPGIETYASLDQMLKRSDVNLITHITPHNLHHPLAKKCLLAGKHVVTEKPFVLTTKEADDLIKTAKAKGLMVSTYHNRHWDGWIMRAKKEIDRGVIGDVIRVEAHMGGYHMPREWWRSSKTISGGILYDWGVHLLEYALQVVPSQVTEVSGFAHRGFWPTKMPAKHPWRNDSNEDEAAAVVRFKNGAYINLSISSVRGHADPYVIAFFGTKGAYMINWKNWTTRIANRKNELVEKVGEHPRSQGYKFYENVAGYLTGREKLVITPEWARRPIHILDLAGQSAKAGKAMKAKYG